MDGKDTSDNQANAYYRRSIQFLSKSDPAKHGYQYDPHT